MGGHEPDATVTRALSAAGVTTTVEELPESRVRVSAEVAPAEIERRVEQAARQLGRNMRIPGFRPGKAPAPVIIRRIGREAVLDEAVRESIGSWYAAAIDDAKIVPVGEPEFDLGQLPTDGAPLKFSIEIGVRPKATLGEYRGLDIPRPSNEVPQEQIDEELERLRERTARLETSDQPASRGDFVVMDFVGTIDGVPFPGGEARDHMLELGSGRFIPGFEDQLQGVGSGEEREVTVEFPADYGAADLAGKEAKFACTIKEIKTKVLPALDDDFAVDQGFDDIAELREDIRTRLAESQAENAEREFREAALDAAVANATVEVPDALIEARARELWDQMAHSLSHQGIPKETYLKLAGKSEEEVVDEARPDAENSLKREAVLAAIVEAEGIVPTDTELMTELEPAAQQSRTTPKKLLERLKSAGRLEGMREEVATARALDLIVETSTGAEQTSDAR